MKYILKMLSLLFFAVFVTYSCQPSAIRKSRMAERSTEVDSVLYYPAKEIKDSFLDSLKIDINKPSRIEAVLYPRKAPLSKYKQVQGFRVQVYAGADSLNARIVENNLKQLAKDSVYFFKESSLFKIQVGDFLYRNDADLLVLNLRKDNFPGAWVATTLINIPKDTSSAKPDTVKETKNITLPYKIQVLVTSDEIKAKTLASQISDHFAVKGFYEKSAEVFKVYGGEYQTRQDAEEKLILLRSGGWPDAWIVSSQK